MIVKRLCGLGLSVVTAVLASCGGEDGGAGEEGAAIGATIYSVTEELRIDGYEHTLVPIDTTIRVAVRPEDGLIAIAQRQTNDVRFFSADGEPLGSLGRQGEGPAEFMQMHRLGWIADTLYAYDFSLRRFTLIDPDLHYVRYIHVPEGAHPPSELEGEVPEFGIVYGGALYADGSVYAQVAAPLSEVRSEVYDPEMTTYGRVAQDGTIISYFQWRSSESEPIEVTLNGRTGFASPDALPSPVRPIIGLNGRGTRYVHIQVAMEGPDAGTFEVQVDDVFGGPLYARRYPYDRVVITQEMKDSILDGRLADAPADFAAAIRRGAVFPPFLPPIAGFVGGMDDTLWIRMADAPEGRPYRIFDPMGEPLGTLTLPVSERIAVADLSQGLVWVIQRDEYDVESIVRYRVSAGGAPLV